VEQLRQSLALKRAQLEAKDAEANEKLKRMVAEQQEAEHRKAASIEIQEALREQDKYIAIRRKTVMAELAEAEPTVIDAQAAVKGIKKTQLSEVRTMADPPEAVKMAMESVCTVIGFRIDSWKAVQQILRRDDFIQSIVNFDTTRQMTKGGTSKPNSAGPKHALCSWTTGLTIPAHVSERWPWSQQERQQGENG
jgi:dynein heavy chain 1